MQASLLPPDGYDYFIGLGGPSISPDGTRIAYTARSKTEAKTHVFVQRLDDGSRIDVGILQVAMPFWSPDSRNVGFFAAIDRKLYRISASGGPAQFICDVAGRGAGGTWNRDGVIVFASGARRL